MHHFQARLLLACCLLSAPLAQSDSLPPAGEFAKAIRADDLTALQKLASTPAAANVPDKLQSTPLHYAAIYGSPAAMRILLNAGADPAARNQSGATPLLYAAWNLDMVRQLVEHGAKVNTAQDDGTTPLMVAASANGNAATIRYLIEKGADVRAINKDHENALLKCSLLSDPETMRLLISHGADAHAADAIGFNGLHNASTYTTSERFRLLLAGGADPNASNAFGGMVKKGPIALVHLSPLMLAAPYSDPDVIAALLKAGARVNETDVRKMTSLMLGIATDHANADVIGQLIAAGADVNAKDANGDSVLTWALKYRNPQVLSMLEAAGAHAPPLPAAPQPAPGSAPAGALEAVQRALPLLAHSGPQFFNESGCAGCHHQPLHARLFAAATKAGLNPDPSLRRDFLDAMLATRPRLAPTLNTLNPPPGDIDPLLAYIMALGDLGEPASEFTDQMIHFVALRQDPSGAWISLGIARPPIEESTISRTAEAVRALQLYGWPARHAEFAERIERARNWLRSSTPVTSYEWADKITGLHDAGVPAADLGKEAAALIQLQRPDGGWAQTPYLDSDAYATGLALHSLYTAGLATPHDPCYRKGVAFLLGTQFPDGSWYVRSRAPKFQPYFQSGFPFNHDQWISSAATSLAAMALADASTPVKVAAVRR